MYYFDVAYKSVCFMKMSVILHHNSLLCLWTILKYLFRLRLSPNLCYIPKAFDFHVMIWNGCLGQAFLKMSVNRFYIQKASLIIIKWLLRLAFNPNVCKHILHSKDFWFSCTVLQWLFREFIVENVCKHILTFNRLLIFMYCFAVALQGIYCWKCMQTYLTCNRLLIFHALFCCGC